jgi:predicted nucleic acid-binding protein
MTAEVFVDSNVLVCARDASEPGKQKKAMAWMESLWSSGVGRLSSQVLQEFYVTVTEKLKPGLDAAGARADVRSLEAWRPIPLDIRVMEGAWSIRDRFRLSWWDALIVATAQIGGCRYLLSEDFQEGQKFGSVRVIHPFHTSPSSINL